MVVTGGANGIGRALCLRFAKEGARLVACADVDEDNGFKVLQEFLLHPRQVLSKDVLLERVWGYDFDANVVEVYIKQLRQKLEAEGEARLIQTIRNVGYVLRER